MIQKHDLKVVRSGNADLLEAIKKLFKENEFLLLELDFSLASSVKFEGKIIESILIIKYKDKGGKYNRIESFLTMEGLDTPIPMDGYKLMIGFRMNFQVNHEGIQSFFKKMDDLCDKFMHREPTL